MAEKGSNKATAATARLLLCTKDSGFRILTGRQKAQLVVEFAKRGMIVYGQAFDLVHCDPGLNLSSESEVAKALDYISCL
jgi:hypothetical protein